MWCFISSALHCSLCSGVMEEGSGGGREGESGEREGGRDWRERGREGGRERVERGREGGREGESGEREGEREGMNKNINYNMCLSWRKGAGYNLGIVDVFVTK